MTWKSWTIPRMSISTAVVLLGVRLLCRHITATGIHEEDALSDDGFRYPSDFDFSLHLTVATKTRSPHSYSLFCLGT